MNRSERRHYEEGWRRLLVRWPHYSLALADEYHRLLSPLISAEDFERAVDRIIFTSREFPRPADFLQDAMMADLDLVRQITLLPKDGLEPVGELGKALVSIVGRLTPIGRRTVAKVGGVGNIRDPHFVPQVFMRAWEDVAVEYALDPEFDA